MANIRQRNNTYQIRVSAGYGLDGKQITKTMTYKPDAAMTKKQIEKELTRQATLFEEKVKNGLAGDGRQTFAEYSRYVIDLKSRTGLKRSTAERYKSFLYYTDIAIGHIKLSSLHPKHLNEFYRQLEQSGTNRRTGEKLSNKTIIEYHRFISSVLSQAEKELLIPFNPARKATPPKAEKTEVNYFQIEEVQKILSCLESEPLKFRALTMLLMTTGARRGEIMGLKWGKINFQSGTVKICNNLLRSNEVGLYEDTPKTHKSRSVKIPSEVLSLLESYKKEFKQLKSANGDKWQGTDTFGLIGSDMWIENDFVFVQDNGAPMHPDTVTKWLNKFSARHGLPHINPHAFRHTAASILIAEGIDIVTVSKQLGHDKVSTTTDIYSHLLEKASEKASEALADVLFQKRAN